MKNQTASKTGVKNQFTLAEHKSLLKEEQNAIQKVATFLLEHQIDTAEAPMNDETLSELHWVYGPKPEPPRGSFDLRHRCQSFYFSATVLAEEKLNYGAFNNWVPMFNLVIDVDDDRAYIVVVDYREEQPFCYLKAYVKSWSFGFKTLKELARQVLEARDTMVGMFLKLTDQQSQKVIQ